MPTSTGMTLDLAGTESTATFLTNPTNWIPSDYFWTLIYGFIVAFVLAFAVGANDVANSFGTAVGAKVLSLKSACILASIFETLGAVFLGAKVGETIRKGIIDVTVYNNTESGTELLMIGEVSAMTGAAAWQLIATVLGLPVSGTHSIVGACIGFAVVTVGSAGIHWAKLGFIIASWFISPVLSGIMTVALYIFVNKVILEKENPMINGLRCLPFFYAFSLGVNCLSIFYTGAPLLGLDMPFWGILLATVVLMVVVGVIVKLIFVPKLRRQAREAEKPVSNGGIVIPTPLKADGTTPPNGVRKDHSKQLFNDPKLQRKNNFLTKQNNLSNRSDEGYEMDTDFSLGVERDDATKMIMSEPLRISMNEKQDCQSYDGDSDSASNYEVSETERLGAKIIDIEAVVDDVDDPESVRMIFSSLQILTACFGGFAHGGNDVSNAIGPLIALWLIYHSGEVVQAGPTPWYLLLFGGFGIVAGLCILGRRVINTIGNDLTKITPSRGFCIELMSALTVLIASNVGIPVSTTHCKVGSVVSIGWYRSRSNVTWSTVRNIAVAWFVTVPVSGLISAGVMYIILLIVK